MFWDSLDQGLRGDKDIIIDVLDVNTESDGLNEKAQMKIFIQIPYEYIPSFCKVLREKRPLNSQIKIIHS